MKFLERLERIVGRKSKRHLPSALTTGRRTADMDELVGLAAKSRAATREPVTMIPATEKRRYLTTDDLDKKEGRLYPDYEVRRKKKPEVEERSVASPGRSVYPDEGI